MPVIVLIACALAACAVSRASAQWPRASVASVTGAHQGKCRDARRQRIEAVLQSLTAHDFYDWRKAACTCFPMTLEQALYDTLGGDAYKRSAVLITLRTPISVPLPTLNGKPIGSASLIVQRVQGNKGSMVFFGVPKPPGWRAGGRIVYVGWGLRDDPFQLAEGECVVAP